MNTIKTFPNSVVFLFLFLFLFSCSKEKQANRRTLTVVFYNVENLFDTEDEPGKNDEEFTPGGAKKWDGQRYEKKLQDLAKVLSSVNENELPEIIGLGEVENEKVVSDLVGTGGLAKGNYQVVLHESPDFRGIDCALAYRTDEFKVVDHFPVGIRFKNEPNFRTRDILYVKGKTRNRETFHIFVNHWPSRIGGEEKTEPVRMEVASVLKNKIDSIFKTDSHAKIIVMGDMNDEPANRSLSKTLGAKFPGDKNAQLINLMFPDDKMETGTYYYRGNWNMLDNLVVSQSLLDDKGFKVKENKGFVFHQSWMEYKSNTGEMSPNRTYGGPNYYGGFSDHFPVYFQLQR